MKYGIAIFPSKAIQDEANALRKRYDPEYAMIPPHITLKPGFNLGDTSISDITKILQEISNDTKPFKININKVSTFAPVTNTIYFKVDPEPELDALHKKIQESISSSDNKDEFSFVPHITISQDLVDEEYHDVFGSLKMKKVELEDYIDRMQLCYQLENGSWQVHETFKFTAN